METGYLIRVNQTVMAMDYLIDTTSNKELVKTYGATEFPTNVMRIAMAMVKQITTKSKRKWISTSIAI